MAKSSSRPTFFFSSRRRHTRSVSAFLLNRSSDLLLFMSINVTMRDIKSKNLYSRVNSKATTQWRKTESANAVHLEGVAGDNRSSLNDNKTTNMTINLSDFF